MESFDNQTILNLSALGLREQQLLPLTSVRTYVDDTIIHAVLTMLEKAFPKIRGFEDTLFREKPALRKKSKPVTANIFHHTDPEHFVATIYDSANIMSFGGAKGRKKGFSCG